MREFAKPNVVVSRCLGFDTCRYNGATIPDEFVEQLGDYVTYITVCPEVEIGLGVPREPIRVVLVDGEPRLFQPATEKDFTVQMRAFAADRLNDLKDIDGFILKGRSPSCGIKDVKVYASPDKAARVVQKGTGFFAEAVFEHYPRVPVEEEGRLKNFTLREHFMTHLFAQADFRSVKTSGTMKDLVRFHSDNKLLLLAYSERHLRVMGPLVANQEKKPVPEIIETYAALLSKALVQPPQRTACINVLMHALGYFSETLSSNEKAYFLDIIQDKYRAKKVPLSVPVSIIGAWIARFEQPYLARQTFFAPYPESLITVSDSGKGRDLG